METRTGAMVRTLFGFSAGIGLLLVGQTDAVETMFPFSGLVAQGGAVGVLAWVCWYLAKLNERQQERFTKTLDDQASRHERWEAARHDDSEKLTAAITGLSVNCAENRANRYESKLKG